MPDDLARRPHHHRPGRDLLAFRNQSVCSDKALLANHSTVEDNGANADQAATADLAPVQHDHVADGAIRTDNHWEAWIGMEHAAVLDIRARADLNWLVIPADHRIEPDAHILAEVNIANNNGILRYPVATLTRRRNAQPIELVEPHSTPSGFLEILLEDRNL